MFIDTNILLNVRFPLATDHNAAREALSKAISSGERLTISRQVIREYLATVTREQDWGTGMTREQMLGDLGAFVQRFEMLEDGPEVARIFDDLFVEVNLGGRQIHDINIVATMLAHGEQRLLSLNTRHFRHFERHIQLITI